MQPSVKAHVISTVEIFTFLTVAFPVYPPCGLLENRTEDIPAKPIFEKDIGRFVEYVVLSPTLARSSHWFDYFPMKYPNVTLLYPEFQFPFKLYTNLVKSCLYNHDQECVSNVVQLDVFNKNKQLNTVKDIGKYLQSVAEPHSFRSCHWGQLCPKYNNCCPRRFWILILIHTLLKISN